ncbi:MAG: aspartate aminotransferase family protein [Deltaproteobacteria bacterium]|nr:aspartate aminotransferase family protein [Deltaproteobacteria bacterium]
MQNLTFTDQEKEQLKKDALSYILPHFASNAELAKGPKIFTKGEGCYVYDIEGRRLLDTFATLLTTICGHRRPEIKEAVLEQMEHLEFFPNYVDTFTIPLIKLAKKLAEAMPGDLSVSFFVNSGSEANETAIKMARQYHLQHSGQPHRYKVICRKYSYHATTLGVTSYTGIPWFREYFEPLTPGAVFVPPARCCECELGLDPSTCDLACLTAMEKAIQWEGPESISAVIMDPIPGSNIGYPLPPDGYLQGVRYLCDKYGILLIYDEVQTGFGKTGKWFACEHWDVVPDIMTIAKGFTGGYMPLGAAVTTPKVADVFRKEPGQELRSGSTYGGHTLACAATLANIEIIQKDNLVEKAAEKGKYLKAELEKLYKYPIVGDVRGIGMIWAIELMADRKSKKKLDPKLGVGSFIRQWCWEHNMILRNNEDILVIAPSLIMSKDEMDIMLNKLNQAIPAAAEHFGL